MILLRINTSHVLICAVWHTWTKRFCHEEKSPRQTSSGSDGKQPSDADALSRKSRRRWRRRHLRSVSAPLGDARSSPEAASASRRQRRSLIPYCPSAIPQLYHECTPRATQEFLRPHTPPPKLNSFHSLPSGRTNLKLIAIRDW